MSHTRRLALLGTLERHERERRDAAQAVLREAQARSDAARAQSQSLAEYCSSYHQRWGGHAGQQLTPELLHCYRSFADRLDHATAVQDTACLTADTQLEHARQALLHREQKLATVQRLIERREHAAAAQQERQDQRQTDEAALRATQRRAV